jgi:hypothetical protein
LETWLWSQVHAAILFDSYNVVAMREIEILKAMRDFGIIWKSKDSAEERLKITRGEVEG